MGRYLKVVPGRAINDRQVFDEVYLVNDDGTPWTPDNPADLASLVVQPGAVKTALDGAYVRQSGVTTGKPSFEGAFTSRRAGSLVGSGLAPLDAKPNGDGHAGVLDWGHNDTMGYLIHLVSGDTPGGALMGVGTDHPGKNGVIFSNKSSSIALGIQNTAASTGTGFDGGNFGTGYLVNLAKGNAGAGVLLNLVGILGATQPLMRWRNPSNTADLGWVEDSGEFNLAGASGHRTRWGHGSGYDQRIHTYTGTPNLFWSYAIKSTGNALLFQAGGSSGNAQGAEALTTLVEVKTGARLGFYGATPVVRAAAIASPTADVASLKTAVDAIRTAIAQIGITL